MTQSLRIKKKDTASDGQSLFEVVVALAMSAVIIVAIVSLATNSISNSTFSKNQSTASTYAQQATEWLRGQRDMDIGTFVDKAGPVGISTTYCLSSLVTNLATRSAGTCSDENTISGTPFIREVKFSPTTQILSSGKTVKLIEADITVRWTDSGGTHKVNSATSFSDWRQR